MVVFFLFLFKKKFELYTGNFTQKSLSFLANRPMHKWWMMGKERYKGGSQIVQVPILVLPLPSCWLLGKLYNIFNPDFTSLL